MGGAARRSTFLTDDLQIQYIHLLESERAAGCKGL